MNGAFASGMAKGIESAEQAGIAERRTALEEDKALFDRVNSRVTATMSMVGDIIKASAAAGKSPEQIQKAVGPLVESIRPMAGKIGIDPASLDAQVQALSNTPQTNWQQKLYDLQVAKFGVDTRQRDEELRLKRMEIENKGAKLVLTPAQQAADQKFGDEYADFVAGGGYADVEKQLGQLDGVIQQLKSGKANLTGWWRGTMPDAIQSWSAEGRQAIGARQAVEEVVQRNLRTVLGSQFTEREGELLIKRAFNPQLEEAENVNRLERLVTQIRTAAKQKQAATEYYETHGTLRGFTGKLPSFNDILGDKGPAKSGATVPPPPSGFVTVD